MEPYFLSNLVAEHIEGKWWKLHYPLVFYSKKLNKTFLVPSGFVTDFASVPRIPLVYTVTGNTGHWEACLHDMTYRWGFIKRNEADNLFNEGGRVRSEMRSNQSKINSVGRSVRNNLMTMAVKLFGWAHYKKFNGCLDIRKKDICNKECEACEDFYEKWKYCCLDGHNIHIFSYHEE